MKLRNLITALILFGFANVSEASECKIRVEYNAGSAIFQNIIALPEQTYQPGGWQSFSQEHITKIENTGRNDLLVRTRNVLTNQIAEYHTVNSGPLTIWFPLPNFTGTALHQVRCLNYSTIHDATDIIAEFGGGPQNLIQQTEAAATQMVMDTKNSLLILADPDTYQNFIVDLDQKRQQLDQKWNELQQLAIEGLDVGEQFIQEYFPELHTAIEASSDVTIDLQDAVLENYRQNLSNFQSKLQEIDQKTGISDEINKRLSVNIEEYFPEVFALGNAQCAIDPAVYDHTVREMEHFYMLLTNFLQAVGNRIDLPDAPLSGNEITQIAQLLSKPSCMDELQEAQNVMMDELKTFMATAGDLILNVKSWQSRWFAENEQQIFEKSRRFVEVSERLINSLERQMQLESRATEFEITLEQHTTFSISFISDFISLDTFTDLAMAQLAIENEQSEKEQIIRQQIDYSDRYEQAEETRQRGRENLRRELDGWQREMDSLAALLSRTRISEPPVLDFLGYANNPEMLSIPSESSRLLRSCMQSFRSDINTALGMITEGYHNFNSMMKELSDQVLPEQLGIVLQYQNEAFARAMVDIRQIGDLRPLVSEYLQSAVSLAQTSEKLLDFEVALVPSTFGPIATPYPNFPGFEEEFRTTYELYFQETERLNEAITGILPGIEEYLDLLSEMNAAFEENRSELTTAAMELSNYSINVLELMRSLYNTSLSVRECTGETFPLVQAAALTFETRMENFIRDLNEMLPPPMPDEVRQRISNLLQLTNQQIEQILNPHPLVMLEDANNRRNTALQVAFTQADFLNFTAFLQTGNQDLAMEYLDSAVNRMAEIDIETTQLRAYLQQIQDTHREALHELELLKEWARIESGEIVNDIHELGMASLNLSPVIQMTDSLLALLPLWVEAKNATPARLQSIVTNEIAQRLEQLRPQVESGIQNFYSYSAAAASCGQDVIGYYTSIAGHSVANSVNQAMANIVGSAPVVFSNLQNLLNPVQSVMNSVEQVINSGKSLIQEAQQSPQTAKNNFDIVVSSAKDMMEQSMVCVNQRSDEIQSTINELNSMFAEIEGFQIQQPIQMQFISFPIQN
jgi:hypothetical protein